MSFSLKLTITLIDTLPSVDTNILSISGGDPLLTVLANTGDLVLSDGSNSLTSSSGFTLLEPNIVRVVFTESTMQFSVNGVATSTEVFDGTLSSGDLQVLSGNSFAVKDLEVYDEALLSSWLTPEETPILVTNVVGDSDTSQVSLGHPLYPRNVVAVESASSVGFGPFPVLTTIPTILSVTTCRLNTSITITTSEPYTNIQSVTLQGVPLGGVVEVDSSTLTANISDGGYGPLGQPVDLVVTDAIGTSLPYSVTVLPPLGYKYVKLTQPAPFFQGSAVDDEIIYTSPVDYNGSSYDTDISELGVVDFGGNVSNIPITLWLNDASDSYLAGTSGTIYSPEIVGPTILSATPCELNSTITITTTGPYNSVQSVTLYGRELTNIVELTSTTLSADLGSGGYGPLNDQAPLAVTDSNGAGPEFAVTLLPPSGYKFVKLTQPAPFFPGSAVNDEIIYTSPVTHNSVVYDIDISEAGVIDFDGNDYDIPLTLWLNDSSDGYLSGTSGIIYSPDLVKPVITLVGGTSTLVVGDTFTPPTVLVQDNKDGDIAGDVVVTGAVDVNTAGNYQLQYNSTDVAGNAADEVVFDVTINPALDTTPPVVTLSGPISTQTGTFDITCAFDEPIVETIVIGMFSLTNVASSTVSGSGLSYTLSVTPTLDASGNVSVTFIAGSVTDTSGNSNVQSNTLTIPFNTEVLDDGEISDTIYSDYQRTTPYTTAGVTYCILNSGMTSIIKTGTLTLDSQGGFTITGPELVDGDYIGVYKSSDGSLLGVEQYTVTL